MNLLFITGTDSKMFGQVGILFDSFHHWNPRQKLYVCDFGLTESQKKIFSKLGVLLSRSHRNLNIPHSWHLKASMVDFLGELTFDAIIWIDADMIVVDYLIPALDLIVEKMFVDENEIGVCSNSPPQNINEFIETLTKIGCDLSEFKNMVDQFNISFTTEYLNSGFFICNSKSLLESWKRLVWSLRIHTLYEQNAFNIVVRQSMGKGLILNSSKWNVHGNLLERIAVRQSDSSESILVNCGREKSKILHATSMDTRHTFLGEVEIPNGGQNLGKCALKLFQNPYLQKIQIHHFSSFLEKYVDSVDKKTIFECRDAD